MRDIKISSPRLYNARCRRWKLEEKTIVMYREKQASRADRSQEYARLKIRHIIDIREVSFCIG